MDYQNFNYMTIGKKPKINLKTGKPRYCQNCGQESSKLFQVITENKVMSQRFFCKKCKNKLEN